MRILSTHEPQDILAPKCSSLDVSPDGHRLVLNNGVASYIYDSGKLRPLVFTPAFFHEQANFSSDGSLVLSSVNVVEKWEFHNHKLKFVGRKNLGISQFGRRHFAHGGVAAHAMLKNDKTIQLLDTATLTIREIEVPLTDGALYNQQSATSPPTDKSWHSLTLETLFSSFHLRTRS